MYFISTPQSARPFHVGPMIAVLVLAILCLAPWSGVLAAPVSSKQAAAVVKGWLSVDRMPLGETLGTAVQRVETYNDAAGAPLYYVAYLESSGYAIVAADDMVEPIVGFAAAGQFDPSINNPLGALVSNDLAARVAYARQAGAKPADISAVQALAKWQQLCPADGGPVIAADLVTFISDLWVAPLTQTTWSQKTAADAGTAACYNYYTPRYGDGMTTNYPSGCVSTAMAQFMRFHQFPTTGVGTTSFTIYVDGSLRTYFLRGGGAGSAYVWADMPLVPPANPTTAQCQAIGALIADAGATVKMSYTSGGSASSMWDAKNALTNTFHFSSARYGYNTNAQLGAGLTAMINPNLDAHYPVLLNIHNASTDFGHAVVADGYGYSLSTLYHHLNLGWSGTATAWYALPLIDTGITDHKFDVVDGCIYNAYTNGGGEIISGRVLDQIFRPVVNATVTAKRSAGGIYTTTTDDQGIYALAKIPSASSYSIAVTKTNYASVTNNFATRTSRDRAATSGNYWGANFTLNMLPMSVDHFAWSALAATQAVNLPFGVTITAQNATDGLATGFTGTVALSAAATGVVSTNTIVGNLGACQAYTDTNNWTFGYAFTPSNTIQIISVRTYSGSKVTIWTDGGTRITSQNVTSPAGVWTETPLVTPVTLSGGATYRVSGYYPAGTPWYATKYGNEWPTNFANGTVGQNCYYVFADGFPNSLWATGLGLFLDLRYIVPYSNSIPVSPTSSGNFVNGVWSGNISMSHAANNVILKADDNAGHVATTTPFNVITVPLLLSHTLLTGGQFQCTIVGAPGQHLQILSSSNLVNWTINTTLTNTNGTTTYTDPTTGLSKRFYRAHQVQ